MSTNVKRTHRLKGSIINQIITNFKKKIIQRIKKHNL